MLTKYTIESARQDLAGYYSRVTFAGKTRHGTGYYPNSEQAEQAARSWVAGMHEMQAISTGDTPLG